MREMGSHCRTTQCDYGLEGNLGKRQVAQTNSAQAQRQHRDKDTVTRTQWMECERLVPQDLC